MDALDKIYKSKETITASVNTPNRENQITLLGRIKRT